MSKIVKVLSITLTVLLAASLLIVASAWKIYDEEVAGTILLIATLVISILIPLLVQRIFYERDANSSNKGC
jgi:hypothetical protein